MTDWTPVLAAAVTGATGVLGGLIGYFAARRQSKVELARIDSENERALAELTEKHVQQRQGIYHAFLDTAHRFHMAGVGSRPFDKDGLATWQEENEHHTSAVRLLGSQAAREAVGSLEKLVDEVLAAALPAQRAAGDGDIGEHLVAAYLPLQERWISTFGHAVSAMRDDVNQSGAKGR